MSRSPSSCHRNATTCPTSKFETSQLGKMLVVTSLTGMPLLVLLHESPDQCTWFRNRTFLPSPASCGLMETPKFTIRGLWRSLPGAQSRDTTPDASANRGEASGRLEVRSQTQPDPARESVVLRPRGMPIIGTQISSGATFNLVTMGPKRWKRILTVLKDFWSGCKNSSFRRHCAQLPVIRGSGPLFKVHCVPNILGKCFELLNDVIHWHKSKKELEIAVTSLVNGDLATHVQKSVLCLYSRTRLTQRIRQLTSKDCAASQRVLMNLSKKCYWCRRRFTNFTST